MNGLQNRFTALLVFASLSLSACSNEKLPKYTVLQGLRVLALPVKATGSDQPELGFDGTNFSDTVQLTPVISDLYGGGRALKYNLQFCLDLGIALGSTPNCESNPTKTTVITNAAVTFVTGSFSAPEYSGTIDAIAAIDFSTMSASGKAVVAAKFATAKNYQRFNGLNMILYYEIYPDGDESLKVSAIKRVVFSAASKAVKNSNPSGLRILDEAGTEIAAFPATESKLQADLPSAVAESYSLMDEDGSVTTKTEVLETTWFLTGPESIADSKDKEKTTDGLFLLSRTLVGELNTFYPPKVAVPSSRNRVVIGVARDDRGGITLKRYAF